MLTQRETRLIIHLAASAFRCMAFACCAASTADLRSASNAASTAAASCFAARALACAQSYHALSNIPATAYSFAFEGPYQLPDRAMSRWGRRSHLRSSRLALLDEGVHRRGPRAGRPLCQRVQLLSVCPGGCQPAGSLLLHSACTSHSMHQAMPPNMPPNRALTSPL